MEFRMPPQAMPVDDRYHAVTPYLIVSDASSAIDFYRRAFGATERMRMQHGGGRVEHAEIKIADTILMLADEVRERDIRSPQAYGGSPVSFLLYVDDVDAFAKKAIGEGLTMVSPIEDKDYGDRMGTFADPFGYHWHIATPIPVKT
jgi:PhnB protein